MTSTSGGVLVSISPTGLSDFGFFKMVVTPAVARSALDQPDEGLQSSKNAPKGVSCQDRESQDKEQPAQHFKE